MEKEFSRRHDIETIALVSVSHASSHFYHLVIPSLFPWLMKDFGLSFTEMGFLATAFFFISAFGQAASGILADKYGARIALFVGLALLGISGLLLACSVNYPMLVAASLCAGAGNSVFHPADYSLINYNISKSRLGHGFAWHGVTGNIGWAVCPLFMVTLATLFSWQTAALGASAVAFAILAVVFIRRKTFTYDQSNDPDDGTQAQKPPTKTLTFLRIPAVWLCFAFFLFTTCGFSCLQNFGPTVFRESYGLNIKEASMALTSYLVCAGAGNLCGGFLTNIKRYSPDTIVALFVGMGAATACFISSCLLTGLWAIPLMGLMGIFIGLASPSRDSLIRGATLKKLSMKSVGRVYGFVYCGMDCGQSLSPILFGAIMDAGLYSYALYGVAFFQCLAILTVLNVGKLVKTNTI